LSQTRARPVGPAATLAIAACLVAGATAAQSRPDPPLDCGAFRGAAERGLCARANDGDPAAEARLGVLYFTGRGVIMNSGEAIRLFRLAAAAAEPAGETYLGYVYETGQGLPKDPAEALRLYRLAAAQGSAQGMNALAWHLATTERALDEAQRWAERAVAQAPEDGTYRDTLARVLLLRGQPQRALTEQQRAVALSPDCASCEDRLGDILAALDRRDDARTHWQRALDLSAGVSLDPEWDAAAVRRKLAGSPKTSR